AGSAGEQWAFSLSNAGSYYAEFRSRLDDLQDLNWEAIHATDFRAADVKEGKQAEFLVTHRFPFELIWRIGVRTAAVKHQVESALRGSPYNPLIEVLPEWYF